MSPKILFLVFALLTTNCAFGGFSMADFRSARLSKKIASWTSENKDTVKLSLSGFRCNIAQDKRSGDWRPTLEFSGTLTNNSAEKIRAVVIELSILNPNSDVVLSKKVLLTLNAFKNIQTRINDTFFGDLRVSGDAQCAEIKDAITKIGTGWRMSYTLIYVIPESLYADLPVLVSDCIEGAQAYSPINAGAE